MLILLTFSYLQSAYVPSIAVWFLLMYSLFKYFLLFKKSSLKYWLLPFITFMLLRHFSDGICHLMDEVKSMKQWKIVSAYSTLVFTNVSSTFTACFYNAYTQLQKFPNCDKEFTTKQSSSNMKKCYANFYKLLDRIMLDEDQVQIHTVISCLTCYLQQPKNCVMLKIYARLAYDVLRVLKSVFLCINLAFSNQHNFATFDILERF